MSQAAMGAVLPQAAFPRARTAAVVTLGALSGMAPDLDVLIQSSADPLLFLEFHRQFTHSLVFVPIGALICATALQPLFRRSIDFRTAYFVCLLGYATHGLLDACTSYGTQLFWPISNYRVSWNTVSVVDPLFTLPLLALVAVSAWRKKRVFAVAGIAWAVGYMALGAIQNVRVETYGAALAHARGHEPLRLTAKPGFANLLAWKLLYEADGVFYVDAVRAGVDLQSCGGSSVERFDTFAWLPPGSTLAEDIERFRWFSDDYLGIDPRSPADAPYVIDIRYSVVPNEIYPLWGIVVDREAPLDSHVDFVAQPRGTADQIAAYRRILTGDSCD